MDQPAAPTLTPIANLWRTYVTDVRADADAHSSTTPQTDRKMVLVFVTAAVALTCGNFLSDGSRPEWLETILRTFGLPGLASRLHDGMLVSTHRDWNQLAFWAVVVIASYVIPPVLVIRFVLREGARDYGLRVRGILPHVR
ncbi:MAG: hypothetical protein QOH28_1716, partial [Actinomycetota bacterium]|nr:hypothetical protein [Actinomycetota bacterium]